MSLKRVANLLEKTMCNASIIDDYDEIIGYEFDEGVEQAEEYHKDVMASIAFINEHCRDKDNQLDPNEWEEIYLDVRSEFVDEDDIEEE